MNSGRRIGHASRRRQPIPVLRTHGFTVGFPVGEAEEIGIHRSYGVAGERLRRLMEKKKAERSKK
jgi:hypothetical protein